MNHCSTPIRSIIFGLIFLAALASMGMAQEPNPQEPEPQAPVQEQVPVSVIKDITFEKIDIADQMVVMIKVEGPFLIETFELIGPRRLVIDFSPVSEVQAQPIYQINDLGLLSIRTGQFQPTVSRVVFDLDARIPSHSIATMPDGVKVVFWQEIVVQPIVQPEEKPEAVTPEQPVLKPAVKPAGPALERPSLFFRIGPGMTLFLKPSFTVLSDFELYGETASITETLSQQANPVFDLSLGKLINPKFSAGLGASLQVLCVNPALEGSLPHPFLYDTYREVVFDTDDLTANMQVVSETVAEPKAVERLTSSMWTIYAWGLYSLFQNEKIDLSAGPMLGISFGKLYSLHDFEIQEEAPFESQNVTITSTTFFENKFFKVDPGFLMSGTFKINDKLSAFATLRIHYVDVMVEELQRRASLFRTNLVLGMEIGF